jgi:hypothetical protein
VWDTGLKEAHTFCEHVHEYLNKKLFIIIIIIGKDTISFMQGIYTYIPETNHVPKEYIVVTILSLLFMVPISLAPALALMCFYIRTFRSMCAVPNMAVLLLLLLFQSIPLYTAETLILNTQKINKPLVTEMDFWSRSAR